MKDRYLDFLQPIKRNSDYVFAFMKIGSGRKLFALDVVIIVIMLFDLYQIYKLNLDVYHFSFANRIWQAIDLPYIGLAVLLVYIPPGLSALTNFFFRDTKTFRTRSIPLRLRGPLLAFHFFVSFAFVFLISISHELQILSGSKTDFGAVAPLVESSFEYSPLYSSIYLKLLTGGGVFLLIVRYIVAAFVNRRDLATEFELWFRLSDTSTDYFPKQRSNLIFVNTASMAPPINWITTKEEFHRHKYQVKVPTSDDAKNYLMRAAEESRSLLREYLFQDGETASKNNFSIEFLPGTSRCLEVGLTQIQNLHTIIVSPYEHPSQLKVVEWFVDLNRQVQLKKLDMQYSILSEGWTEQKSWLIDAIKTAIPQDANGKVAILISDVHFLSGLVINVTEIITELRPNYGASNLVFIVDGSQSVGNLLKPFDAEILHDDDFYYFSAHKWLLSPNTCGVLVAKVDPDRYNIYPYDMFGPVPPSATVDPGVIFGIRSSLEYLIGKKMFRLNKFHEKSSLLKAYFIEKISEKYEVIESKSQEMNQSIFIALRPRTGHWWKEDTKNNFWLQITQDGVDLSVIELEGLEPQTWWLRVSFPYFLQLHLLKQLIKHLKARVRSIN
jgi:hypothetical protein